MGVNKTWTDEKLKEAIEHCQNWGQVCKYLGISNGSKNRKNVKKRAAELNLEISHLG